MRLYFGNIIHSVLEDNVSKEEKLDHTKLVESYQEQAKKQDPDKIVGDQLVEVGTTIINEFFDQYGESTFDVFDKEYEFKFIIGSYSILGYIDRIDIVDEKTLKIIDYKTGKWEVAQKDIQNNLQLGIYALAVSEAFPDKNIYAELYYLRSGRRKGHLFTKEDLENVKQNLIKEINKITEDTFFHPTKNERACTYCDFAKSGACNTGVFRLRKFAKA